MPNLFIIQKYIWTFVFWEVRSEKVISTKNLEVQEIIETQSDHKKKSEIKETFCEENPATIL